MKKYILLVAIFCTGILLQAQSTDENKQLSRKERKELEHKQNNENLKGFHDLLTTKSWIIPATQIRTMEGETGNIEAQYNYVYMTGDSAIVQISFPDFMGFGANNLGGVTVEGKVTKYSLTEFKENKQVELQMQVDGQVNRITQLSISIMASGHAVVKVYPRQGPSFIFEGELKPYTDYPIFKGDSNW